MMGKTSKAVTKSIIRNLEMNGTLDNHTSRLETQQKAIKNTDDDDIEEEDEEDEEEEIVEVKKGKLVNEETTLLHTVRFMELDLVQPGNRGTTGLCNHSETGITVCCIHCSQNLLLSSNVDGCTVRACAKQKGTQHFV